MRDSAFIAALVLLLLLLLALALLGDARRLFWHATKPTITKSLEPGEKRDTLFVLIHGLAWSPGATWKAVIPALKKEGDVLIIGYPSSPFSTAKAEDVSRRISAKIQTASDEKHYANIVLVGYSVGGLIARRAILERQDFSSGRLWQTLVCRLVLVAGTNRGWDIVGKKPSDMTTLKRSGYWLATWISRLTGFGSFVLEAELGSPFVANLRLEWMRWIRQHKQLELVQLLGDIDDVVSDEDNQDLRVMSSAKFALLRVRGSGHASIVSFEDENSAEGGIKLGTYRKTKFLLATTRPFNELKAQNEEQPYATDENVSDVVFILHGIRDLGEWSSQFELALRAKFDVRGRKVAIVSSRYGYFGMGPFLFKAIRKRYVRWFMDQYTETLARYPNVKDENIHFVGHSNGTYILTSALDQYRAMKINRVVLGGSVVRADYAWQAVLNRRQVQTVRNYVGTADWVVALFPRVFEMSLLRWLQNDIGSAGFNGFLDGDCLRRVENIKYVQGQHSAFLSRVDEISQYMVAGDRAPAITVQRTGWQGKILESALSVWIVWGVLMFVLAYVGLRVVSSAPKPASLMLVMYIALVITILRTL